MYKKLYIGGAGSNIFLYMGALYYFHKLYPTLFTSDLNIYIGSSAGFLLCILLILGFTPIEIYSIFISCKHYFMNQFQLKLESIYDFFLTFGFLNQSFIATIIIELGKYKNLAIDENTTLFEFYQLTNKTLYGVVCNITTNKILLFSHLNEPNLSLWKLIQMTIAIPFIFQPILYQNHYYVDGNYFTNYPYNLISQEISIDNLLFLCILNETNTIHNKSVSQLKQSNLTNESNQFNQLYHYICQLFASFIYYHYNENQYYNNLIHSKRIIPNHLIIPLTIPNNISFLQFNMTDHDTYQLFLSGFHQIQQIIHK